MFMLTMMIGDVPWQTPFEQSVCELPEQEFLASSATSITQPFRCDVQNALLDFQWMCQFQLTTFVIVFENNSVSFSVN